MIAAVPDPVERPADDEPDQLALELGPIPEDTPPPRFVIDLPRQRLLTLARPRRVSDERRASVTRIRAGVPVLVEHPDGGTVPGTWSTICRSPSQPGGWVMVPHSDDASAWAAARDLSQLDAHAWSLIPLRHLS